MKNKVICTKVQPAVYEFTIGKIYEVGENGYIIGNSGGKFSFLDIINNSCNFVPYVEKIENYEIVKEIKNSFELEIGKEYLVYRKGKSWSKKYSEIAQYVDDKKISSIPILYMNEGNFFYGYRVDEKDSYSIEVYEITKRNKVELKDGMLITYRIAGVNKERVLFKNKLYDVKTMMFVLDREEVGFKNEGKTFEIEKVTYEGETIYESRKYYTLKEALEKGNKIKHMHAFNFSETLEDIIQGLAVYLEAYNAICPKQLTDKEINLKVLEEIDREVWEVEE